MSTALWFQRLVVSVQRRNGARAFRFERRRLNGPFASLASGVSKAGIGCLVGAVSISGVVFAQTHATPAPLQSSSASSYGEEASVPASSSAFGLPTSVKPTSGAQRVRCGDWVDGLPEFTPAEVAQHRSRAARVWIMYRHGVYDITDFLDLHPGGPERLLYAAGRDIGPFWAALPIHEQDRVRLLMEGYRIGNVNHWFDHVTGGGVDAAAVRKRGTEADEGLVWGAVGALRRWLVPDMAAIRQQGAEQRALARIAAEQEAAKREAEASGVVTPAEELRRRPSVQTAHDRQWAEWKRRMHGADGNMCTREAGAGDGDAGDETGAAGDSQLPAAATEEKRA